jgi:rod shape-determining protein MreD
MIWKHIWTFIIGLVFLFLQLLLMPVFELWKVIPNILIPWIVYLIWTRELNAVLIIVFLIGALYDTTLPESFGMHSLIFILIAFGTDWFRRPFETQSILARILTLLLANIIFSLLEFLVMGVTYGFDNALFGRSTLAFVYNLALSFVVFWVLQFLSRLRLVVLSD